MKPRLKLKPFLICILGLYGFSWSFSETVLVSAFGYTVELPPDWKILDSQDPHLISFTDASNRAIFQIAVLSSDHFKDAREMLQFAKAKFNARGDIATFIYDQKEAALADFTFLAGRYPARGYFIGLPHAPHPYLLTGFTSVSYYEEFHDTLLSLLDSFSPSAEARKAPGIISQFYNPFPDPKSLTKSISKDNVSLPFQIGSGEGEANSVVIEREARVLSRYVTQPKLFVEAWKRYYQVVYRDTYLRLASLANVIDAHYKESKIPRHQYPHELLRWVQSFTYSRPANVSDLASPVEVALSATGDCDARALLFIVLLNHWGFDAILMVSHTYKHAMAAIDIPGQGARMEFEGKKYLVAEVTDKVNMGLINRDMANPAEWIPISFNGSIRP
ncbi:MAG: hypothetical protein SNJ78_00055 [Spirochaetales bacterium]